MKNSWWILSNYYKWNYLYCPTPAQRSPTVTLQPESNYYTVYQPIRMRWTASEATSIQITNTPANVASYACDTGELISPSSVAGSCGVAHGALLLTPGQYNYSATAYNGSSSWVAGATVNVGAGPIINAIQDSTGSSTINVNDTIILWGQGFSRFNTSFVRFSRPGYSDVWAWPYDGYYYWNYSYNQINLSLGGRLSPGQWTVTVHNGYAPQFSAAYSVYVNY